MKRMFAPFLCLTGLALVLANACKAPDPTGEDSTGGDGDTGIIDPTTSDSDSSTTESSTEITDPTADSATTDVEETTDTEDENPIQQDCDTSLELIVRDFNSDHPDMEEAFAGWNEIGCGMVKDTLFIGTDGARTPVFQANNGTGKRTITAGTISCLAWDPSSNPTAPEVVITSEDSFNQWFSTIDGVNMAITHTLELAPVDPNDANSNYYFDSKELDGARFFPADGLGFNEQTQGHNYHFTSEAHVRFTYNSGDKFTFSGDDDMWIFVNNKIALDLGGLHGPLSATIDFDAQASALGITAGMVYNMDIFHAERHTSDSNYRIETSIGCFEKVEVPDVIIR